MSNKIASSNLKRSVEGIEPGFTMTVSLGAIATDVTYGESTSLSFEDVYVAGKDDRLLGESMPSNIFDDPTLIGDIMPLVNLRGGAIPTGGCIIAGGPDKGKTPAIQAIANAIRSTYGDESVVYIRFGEPLPGYLTDPIELLQQVAAAMADPKVRLIAIDSLKDIMGQMKGQLMARGIPRLFFVVFSQWSSMAASLGKTIITPLNVSTDSAEAIAEVETACLSNSTCTITVQSSATNKIVYTGIARTGDGKPRSKVTMVVSFDAAGSPSIVMSDSLAEELKTDIGVDSPVFTINFSQRSAVSRALTRHIRVDTDNQNDQE